MGGHQEISALDALASNILASGVLEQRNARIVVTGGRMITREKGAMRNELFGYNSGHQIKVLKYIIKANSNIGI